MTVRQIFIAMLLVTGLLAEVLASEFSGYVTLTTDYVKRGVTQSDGDPAVLLGGDIAFDSGIYVGIWGSSVDINNDATLRRDVEINYYLGYSHELSEKWQVNANVVAYEYPGAKGDIKYDYVEYTLAANYNDGLWLGYSYSPDLFHSNQSTHNVDAYAEWSVDRNWALGGGGGYYDISNLSNRGYGYWQIGVTRSFAYSDIDLRYHDANRWAPIVSSPDRVGARVSLTIRFPF